MMSMCCKYKKTIMYPPVCRTDCGFSVYHDKGTEVYTTLNDTFVEDYWILICMFSRL